MKEFIRSQWTKAMRSLAAAEATLASATKAIEKARTILTALEPLLPDDAAGNA